MYYESVKWGCVCSLYPLASDLGYYIRHFNRGWITTQENVCAQLFRVLRTSSTMEDTIYTLEGYHQHCGGIPSVQWRDTISTVEVYHENCGALLVLWEDFISTEGISSVQWGLFITVGGYHQYWGGGIPLVLRWRDTICTLEIVQYCWRKPSALWRDAMSTVEDSKQGRERVRIVLFFVPGT